MRTKRWSVRQELKEAVKAHDPITACSIVQASKVGSGMREEAIRAWLKAESSCEGFRRLYHYPEHGSELEGEVVKKWARYARTKEELLEVLPKVRMLENEKLEHTILQRLRKKHHYREAREIVKTFLQSLFSRRKTTVHA